MAGTSNITKEFLERALQGPIRTFSVSQGSKPGDNFMSVLYAIEVEQEDGPALHLLLKAYPTHPWYRDYLNQVNIFSKEIQVYQVIIPQLLALRNPDLEEELRIPVPTLIAAKASSPETADEDDLEPRNFLLMVDIRRSFGYKMADRIEGLDYEHSKLVMDGLALIHAYGWAYKQQNNNQKLLDKFPFLLDLVYAHCAGTEVAELMETLDRNALADIKAVLGEGSEAYKGAQKILGGDSVKYLEHFFGPEGIDETLVEGWFRVPAEELPGYTKETWLVICHGDCWVNNLLFLYDSSGKPTKLTFVDLQIVREACPTTDLAYYFYTSTSPEFRKEHQDELLQIYHDKFVHYCRLLNCDLLPGFNYKSLKRRYRRATLLGFIMSLQLLPVVLKPREDALDLATLKTGTEDMSKMDIFDSFVGDSQKNSKLQLWFSSIAKELYEDGVL